MDNKFYINKIINAIIDRPLGSKHPIVPENKVYNQEAIEALIEFQERYFEHIIIK